MSYWAHEPAEFAASSLDLMATNDGAVLVSLDGDTWQLVHQHAAKVAVTALSFAVRSQDDTATAGTDYFAVDEELTFPAGSTENTVLSVDLTVFDDLNVEDDESLVLSISATGSGRP